MKIKIDEILKYIMDKITPDAAKQEFKKEIKLAIKELNIDVSNDEVSAEDASKISEFVIEKFKKDVKQEKGDRGSFFGFFKAFIVFGAIGYTAYDLKYDNRYSVEQEYSWMSTCAGEQASKRRKEYCIKKLKQCLKEDKKLTDCY